MESETLKPVCKHFISIFILAASQINAVVVSAYSSSLSRTTCAEILDCVLERQRAGSRLSEGPHCYLWLEKPDSICHSTGVHEIAPALCMAHRYHDVSSQQPWGCEACYLVYWFIVNFKSHFFITSEFKIKLLLDKRVNPWIIERDLV